MMLKKIPWKTPLENSLKRLKIIDKNPRSSKVGGLQPVIILKVDSNTSVFPR